MSLARYCLFSPCIAFNPPSSSLPLSCPFQSLFIPSLARSARKFTHISSTPPYLLQYTVNWRRCHSRIRLTTNLKRTTTTLINVQQSFVAVAVRLSGLPLDWSTRIRIAPMSCRFRYGTCAIRTHNLPAFRVSLIQLSSSHPLVDAHQLHTQNNCQSLLFSSSDSHRISSSTCARQLWAGQCLYRPCPRS